MMDQSKEKKSIHLKRIYLSELLSIDSRFTFEHRFFHAKSFFQTITNLINDNDNIPIVIKRKKIHDKELSEKYESLLKLYPSVTHAKIEKEIQVVYFTLYDNYTSEEYKDKQVILLVSYHLEGYKKIALSIHLSDVYQVLKKISDCIKNDKIFENYYLYEYEDLTTYIEKDLYYRKTNSVINSIIKSFKKLKIFR